MTELAMLLFCTRENFYLYISPKGRSFQEVRTHTHVCVLQIVSQPGWSAAWSKSLEYHGGGQKKWGKM